MKKKFVLTLALVLMVAVSLTAAPLEIAGEFSAGRTFSFDPNGIAAANNVKLNKVSASSDFWKISIDGGAVLLNGGMTGVADIYLDKALAEQGMDMGELALTLSVGNKTDAGLLHVYYDDPAGELKMTGPLASGTVDLKVGYGSMVTAKTSFNFDKTELPFALSAKVTPLDGIAVAVGFTNYSGALESKGGIAGSASVDVAALTGLDFGLSAYLYDSYMLDTKTNMLNAAMKASFAEVYLTVAMDAKNAFDVIGMSVKGEYKGIENVGLSAKLSFADLKNPKAVISGDASYTMGGVKYKVAVKHDSSVAAGVAKLTVSPSVTIKF